MKKKIVFAALGVVALMLAAAGLLTAWFYIGGMEAEDMPLSDSADLCWSPVEIADEDNAFIAVLAATNHIRLATNSWGGVDTTFIGSYGNLRDHNSRRIRAEAGAVEKADRILADNAAFYAAFAKGLERNGFRNTLPPPIALRHAMLPASKFMCMAWLWQFKIQRDAELGEWDNAVESIETLHRFGRMVSDNSALITDLYLGNGITGMAYAKICDIVSLGGLRDDQLARLAALVEADEMVEKDNIVQVVKSEHAFMRANVSEMSPEMLIGLYAYGSKVHGRVFEVLAAVSGLSVSKGPSFSDRLSDFLVRTLFRWPGYFGYTLHRRTTLSSLEDIVRGIVEGDARSAVCRCGDEPKSLLSRNALGREIVHTFASSIEWVTDGTSRRKQMFARIRAQLVLAAARWRRAHNGELPPALDALVPKCLSAVPLDPWAKDGEPLNYDAESGVAWSVGKDGRFNYMVMKNAKPTVQRQAKDRIVSCSFRLDGKPLEITDESK